jgi:hypothetical protein
MHANRAASLARILTHAGTLPELISHSRGYYFSHQRDAHRPTLTTRTVPEHTDSALRFTQARVTCWTDEHGFMPSFWSSIIPLVSTMTTKKSKFCPVSSKNAQPEPVSAGMAADRAFVSSVSSAFSCFFLLSYRARIPLALHPLSRRSTVLASLAPRGNGHASRRTSRQSAGESARSESPSI